MIKSVSTHPKVFCSEKRENIDMRSLIKGYN
jgi:hypothetical protein